MKKILILACLFSSSLFVWGQSTSVTLSVIDADGQAWGNGTWAVTLTVPPGNPAPSKYNILGTNNPVPNQQQTGVLSFGGGASLTLTPNNSIAPAGTVWSFFVCPQATGACFTQTLTITGSSQTVTINPPGIRISLISPPPIVLAYSDAEIINQSLGSQYFNLVSLSQRVWNGFSWNSLSTLSTVTSTPAIAVSPSLINFGSLQTSTTSQTQSVTITNIGTALLVVLSVTSSNLDFSTPDFTTCNGTISPGSNCTLLFTFTPSSATAESATVTVNSNATNPPNNVNSLPNQALLSGTGTAGTSFPLTINCGTGTGSGLVASDETPNPVINCSCSSGTPTGACNDSYANGATPTFTETPDANSTLLSVSGSGVACTTNPCTPTISGSGTITVNFTPVITTFSVTFQGIDQGIGTIASDLNDVITGQPINCTSTAGFLTGKCQATFNQGQSPVFTETPSGSCTGGACTFLGWGGVTGTGCTTGSTCQPTVNSILAISADFAQPAAGAPLTLVQKISGGTLGGSAPTFVKACSNFVSGSSATLTVTCSIAAGHAAVGFFSNGSQRLATATVSDSASQSWTQTASGYTDNGGSTAVRSGIWFFANTASITSITATWSQATSGNLGVVYDLSGMATSSLEDSSIDINSNNGLVTSLTSGSLTTTNANDILLYGLRTDGDGGGFTAGSGYTIPTNGNASTRGAIQYKIVTSTQAGVTTSMSWPTARSAGSVFAAFKGLPGSNTVTGNWASAQNAGDVNVCGVLWNDNTTTVSSIVDTKGNTYTQFAACSPKTIAGLSAAAYHADNIVAATAGADTITVTLSASPTTVKLNCIEYSGAIAAPFDACTGATGTGTAIASGNVTTAQANEQLVGFDAIAGSITAISPNFTQQISPNLGDVEDRAVAVPAAYNFTPTQGTAVNWAAIVGAFKTSGTSTTFVVNFICAGAGSGTVTFSGSTLNCAAGAPSGTQSIVVIAGATLNNILATAGSGSAFGLYNGGGCGTNPSCSTVAITSNITITATFNIAQSTGTFNVLSPPTVANRPYPTAYYNQQLPNAGSGGPPSNHWMPNSAAIITTMFATGPVNAGTGQWSNGLGLNDLQHRPFYYGQATDPVYQVAGCTGAATFVNGQKFHAPSGAPFSQSDSDEEIIIWDQPSGNVFGFYNFNSAGTLAAVATLPACSGTINSPCTYNHNGNGYCSMQARSSGSGVNGGTAASSAGIAPFGNVIRFTEILNAVNINHGLRLLTHCDGTNNGAYPSHLVFPANQATGGPALVCATGGAASTPDTNRPPNGALFFLDYTTAQLNCFDPSQAACAGINKIQNPQFLFIKAMTLYGGTIEDTGLGNSLAWPGIESDIPMRFYETRGYPGALAQATAFTNYMTSHCTAPFCTISNRNNGSIVWALQMWNGISNVNGTGVVSHLHIADPCVAISMQGFANDGHGTNACP